MTDCEVAREVHVLKMSNSDEAITPQRSILDFFKTPQKDTMTAKPKGLLGFFCKKENNGAKKSMEINCNGKEISATKQNMLKKENGGKGEKNKLQKKRKRSTSNDQGSSDNDYGENGKTSRRKNKLKRKKEEIEKVKDSGKTNSEAMTDTTGVVGTCVEGTESQTTAGSNSGEIIDVDTDLCEVEQKNEGRAVQMEIVEVIGSDSEGSRGMDKEVEEMADEREAGVEVRRGGCSQEREGEQGANLGKKQINIEKCRTPKDKSKEKSGRNNKLRKKKKESDLQETVNKSSNLPDDNMADVSVISDAGVNMDSADTEDESVQEKNENETENTLKKVNSDKLESSGEVEEESYEHFLLMQNCVSKNVDMVEKEDVCEQMEEKDTAKEKIQKGTSKETRGNQQTSGSTHSNNPVEKDKPVKKRGRPKKADAVHTTSNSGSDSSEMAVGDKDQDGKSGDEVDDVKEVSYTDYLITIGEDESEGKTKAKRSINDLLGKGVENTDLQAQDVGHSKSCEDDGADIPMPKQYPSITNFFSKVNRNVKPQDSKSKAKSDQMTIKAVVHEQNRQNEKGKEGKSDKKNGIRKLQLSKQKNEDTIQVLSSEIIVIDDKTMDVNIHRKEKCVSQDLTEQTEAGDVIDLSEEEKVKKNLFLHSVTAPEKSVKQKMSQATIKFTDKGLQMKKTKRDPVAKPPEETCGSTTEPKKRKRGRPKGICKKGNVGTAQFDSSQSDPDSSKPMEVDSKDSCESLVDRRKSLRLKYKVRILQNKDDGRPIKMKFMRCSKSSSGSSQNEALTPKSKEKTRPRSVLRKQSKAQKLLEKAKKVKGDKKKGDRVNSKVKKIIKTKERGIDMAVCSDSKNEEPGGRRRSSRLSDRQKSLQEIEIVDLDDEDDDTGDSCYTPTKPNKKSRAQKQTSAKKPTEVKNIAPIFLKKKPKAAATSPVKKVLDPETEKLKRAFLMSGIPAELKQSATAAASNVVTNYPPLPRDNHVQQKSESRMWSVQNVVLKTVAETDFCSQIPQAWSLGTTLRHQKMNSLNTDVHKPLQSEKFKDDILSCLLKETSRACPSFPTQKVYNILREKQDDEGTEEKDEKSKEKETKGKTEKEKPRRSLRRRKEVIEIIDVGGSPESKADQDKKEDKQENVPLALSWSEKYQPLHSSEIIGNTAIIKKLKAWLIQWKECLDKEAKRARLMMMKEKKKNQKLKEEEEEEEWWTDDASDFDMDSDSDGEERLCNTAMLTGPLGVGKTATVYALAQELGFKVLEVNASSNRNGKRILAQLQEATQSQQVSKHHFSGTGSPKKLTNSANVDAHSKPTVFTNLFKKTANQQCSDGKKEKANLGGKKLKGKKDTDKVEKEQKKRKKGEDLTKTSLQEKKKSVNLSCTSLILFDEVDLVFEAFDKGFWAAVKNFMDSTKIPIILTSNDGTLPQKFEGKFEHYKFKAPSIISTSCYLRLVALVENFRIDWDEIVNLVTMCHSDLRRVLLLLQFWLNSGGGQKVKRPIKDIEPEVHQQAVRHLPVNDENSCSRDAVDELKRETRTKLNSIADDGDEDDDFVSIRPITCKRNRVICDDENSNSNVTPPVSGKELIDADKCPTVNVSCVESMLGLPIKNESGILRFLIKTLQDDSGKDEELAIQACQQYLKLKVDLLYDHHLEMLPMNKIVVDNLGPIKKAPSPAKTKRRRIRMTSDLYDSEGSDSEPANTPETIPVTGEKSKQSETNSQELIGSLSEFARYYDSLSFTDTLRSVEESIVGEGNSECGMTENPQMHEHSELWMQENASEVRFSIEWKSLDKLHRKLREVQQGLADKNDERFTVPVMKGRSSTLTQGLACPDIRSWNSIDKAYRNVLTTLPLSVQGQKSAVMSDYLPYLRSITKDEQIRQAAKLKRRFHHYFDQIGLHLKDQSLEVLKLSFS